jgi:hypothetical protein
MKLCMAAFALMSFALSGCGHAFDVKTAPGFVHVKEEGAAYDYRAIAPDGVAVALRSVDVDDKTSVSFWEHAVILRTRELDGYALVTRTDVRSRDGTAGRELVFGHDEQGKPFVYRVRLFLSGSKLVVVEAGGAKENMERWKPSVDWMLASVRVD